MSIRLPTFAFAAPDGYLLNTAYGSGNGYVFDTTAKSLSVQFVAVPEPSTCVLLAASGLLGCAWLCRRFRASPSR